MRFKINYANIPVLAIGFTRSNSLIAKSIQLFRKVLWDKDAPNHVFIVTEDHGQLFATEETIHGLQENSLEKYTSGNDRIVALYTWKGFDDPSARESAQRYLAEIRRRAKEDSKYDFWGLFSFVPGIRKLVKPDPKKQWCSENAANLLKTYGYADLIKTTISPDQLLKVVKNHKEAFNAVLSYYIM